MIIAVINNKGGTGKTTTCVTLAAAFALKRKRVLVADLDPQASASLALGVEWNALSPSWADVVFDGIPAADAVRKAVLPGVDLLPAEMELASFDLTMGDRPDRDQRIRDAMAPLRDDYDLILCDCPPAMSLLSVNALVAADGFLVPVTPEYLALEGLVSLMDAVDRMRNSLGITADFIGIVFTMVSRSFKTSRDIMTLVRKHYDSRVLDTEIPRNVKLLEAPAFGSSVFDLAPGSPGAKAYTALAEELLVRLNMAETVARKSPASSNRPPGTLRKRKSS